MKYEISLRGILDMKAEGSRSQLDQLQLLLISKGHGEREEKERDRWTFRILYIHGKGKSQGLYYYSLVDFLSVCFKRARTRQGIRSDWIDS